MKIEIIILEYEFSNEDKYFDNQNIAKAYCAARFPYFVFISLGIIKNTF